MKITRVHHLTLAVRDVDAARRTFEEIFGAQALDGPAMVPAFGVRAADLALGDSAIELVAPAGADNPLMRFLERRGEGFYTLALEVDDLEAAIAELAARGVRVSEPVEARPGLRSAFITMAATHGLSVQLVQVLHDEPSPAPAPQPQPAAEPDASPVDDAPPPLDLTPDEWSDVD